MTLTKKTRSLSRTAAVGLALATGMTFGAGAMLAHAMSLQTNLKLLMRQKSSREPGTGCSMEGVSPL